MKGTRPFRAAHFLLHAGLAGSPPNEALIAALLSLGGEVDVYAPNATDELQHWGPKVRLLPVAYRLAWLSRHAFSLRWRRYALLSGTCELPMGVVGTLSALHGVPALTMADEIRAGSYAGQSPRYWKALARRGMRRSRLTVVNDEARVPLQRQYADLANDRPVIVYPSAFHTPPAPADRAARRREQDLPEDAFVVSFSGELNAATGALWIPDILSGCPDVHVAVKTRSAEPLALGLLPHVKGAERLHIDTRSVSWREAWAGAAAADVGMVIYLHDGPQFRQMGKSSNRLCMFLAMGVPVVATRQPSFEFIERHGAGVLIDGPEQACAAIATIRGNLDHYRQGARTAFAEHVAPTAHHQNLVGELQTLLVPSRGALPWTRTVTP